MGMLKSRTYSKAGDKNTAAVKRKKSVNVNGKDVEQFSDSDIAFNGYLVKQGSFWKTWRRRYFILRRDVPLLAYYESQEKLTKLGEITIDNTTTVKRAPRDGFPYLFIVEHASRKLTLVAEDGENSLQSWIGCIRECIQKRTMEFVARQSLPTLDRRSMSTGSSALPPTRESMAEEFAAMSASPHHRFLSNSGRESPMHKTMIRQATDSLVIQNVANQAMAQERAFRVSRLPSIDGANSGAAKPPLRPRNSQRCLVRSKSDSCLSSTHSMVSQVPRAHDDCGLSTAVRSKQDSTKIVKHKAQPINEHQTRSQCLDLSSFRKPPGIELVVSVGSKGAQSAAHMVVVLSSLVLGHEPVELSRTEMQGALSLRSCGVGDFYARDFNTLLYVPLNARETLQFEIFAFVNPNTESLANQQLLGVVCVSPMDLLFSRDSTLVLECRRAPGNKQLHFLIVDRVVPSESLNLGHSYMFAKRYFIADTVAYERRKSISGDKMHSTGSAPSSLGLSYRSMMRGKVDSQDANHVLVSEELSASYCSIGVSVEYIKYLQIRNNKSIQTISQFITKKKETYRQLLDDPNKADNRDIIEAHEDMIREWEEKLTQYKQKYVSYMRCEEYYAALLFTLEDGKEPGITSCLKRSTMKKDKYAAFMPTNLCTHLLRAKRVILSSGDPAGAIAPSSSNPKGETSGGISDELLHSAITHGCPAAHTLGFKEGGLRRMEEKLSSDHKKDEKFMERLEQRRDIVRSQILCIASAAYLSLVGLAAKKSSAHQMQLQLTCSTGFLLSMESLLSTYGSEIGMIEDMAEGIKWLNTHVTLQILQSMEKNPKLKYSKCVGISDSISKDEVVVTFAVPPEVFEILPDVLQQGAAIKIHAVLFTQGVNEMQSMANNVSDTSLQDDINFESVKRLEHYFQVYETEMKSLLKNNQFGPSFEQQRHVILNGMMELKSELLGLVHRLNTTRASHVQKKNVNILLESSDICRKMGAARTTCCKSGKDRTSMSVTLECSRILVDGFHVKQGIHLCSAMRERGVRRVNVLANTGKSKYAFNSFQLKYIPDCYKPPIATADSHIAS